MNVDNRGTKSASISIFIGTPFHSSIYFPNFFIYIVVAVCLRSNRNITFGHGAAKSLFRKIKIKRAVRFEAVILIQFSGPENEIMGKRTIFTKTPTHKNKGKNDEKDERKQNGYLKN